jgi:hypothetical protein
MPTALAPSLLLRQGTAQAGPTLQDSAAPTGDSREAPPPNGARAVTITRRRQVVMSGPGYYKGFSLRETAGATAVVRLYDHSRAASGALIETVSLVAHESTSDWYAPDGIHCANGLVVDVVEGSVEGSVRVG